MSKSVVVEFPNKQARDAFLTWFNSSGEQHFMRSCEYRCDGEGVINNVDYTYAFPALGYNPKIHGAPTVKCQHINKEK